VRTARVLAGLTAVVATFILSHASAAEPGAVQWVKTPSARLDPQSWPERALRMEVDGEATLHCAYDAQGILGDCKVMSETPSGYAFGLAAMRMTRRFKLKPVLSDGSPLKPGEITFVVPFRVIEWR
jgi:protein TonB